MYTIQADLVSLLFAFLCFTDTMFFYKSNFCGSPGSSKSIRAIAHFISLCHILVILKIFQFFKIIIIYVTVTCDQ